MDLLHHTSYPAWLVDGFVDPRFGAAYVRFCAAVAERYPWLSAYTLVNEPFATLFLAGHEALWPPYRRGLDGFVSLLPAVLPPLAEAAVIWRAALPEAAHVWVDTAEHHAGRGGGADYAELCNDRRHVALDLFLGHDLDVERPFLQRLVAAGGEDLLTLPHGAIDLLGLDYYPHSEWFYDDAGGRAPSPEPVRLARIISAYGERYAVPLLLTETNIRGLPSDRVTWLRHVLEQCEQAVAAGYDLRGLCWFPQVDSHDWDSMLALYRGRPDPVGVHGWPRAGDSGGLCDSWDGGDSWDRGDSGHTVFSAAWRAVAAGACAADLPAYRWQPPCDTQLAGFASLMPDWPWQDPPHGERVTSRPVPRPHLSPDDEGAAMSTRNGRDLVVLAHLRWTWVWQRPHHLVSRLAGWRAEGGRHTWYVEEPVPADVATPALRTEQHGDVTRVWLEVPRRGDGSVPHPHVDFDADEAAGYGDLLQGFLREHGATSPDVWIYTPTAIDLLVALHPHRLVYDVMDDLASFRHAPPRLRERQQHLLDTADVVFTGGRSLHEGVLRHRTEDVHLFPSGVESAHFAGARPQRGSHDRPVAGYVGVIDERVDLDLVGRLAERLPGWTVQMVGPITKIDPACLPQAPNIDYPGLVAYADLPGVLAGFDVALMPFALNEATRSISPTKTLEYLAAVLPVISTRVPDVVNVYGDVVHLADDGEEFAAAAEHLLRADDGEQRDRLCGPLLHAQEWDTIALEMADLLDRVPVRAGPLAHDLEQAHHVGVGAAVNGLQDAALGERRLSGDGVDHLADAAVASATPFLRAPLLSRLSDVGRLHPRVGTLCPTCGTPVPCATARVMA